MSYLDRLTKYSVLVFALILLAFMVMSEFFQVSQYRGEDSLGLSNPVKREILEQLSTLTVTNSLGTYHLAKMGESWRLLRPRNLQARSDLVGEIIQTLKNLKVRRLYEKDKINLQNFSLHRPTIELVLTAFGQSQKLKIGLLNSIDDSTYLTFNQSSSIYQIDLFKLAIQSLDLSDFINSKIFKEPLESIQKIQVKRQYRQPLTLMRENEAWSAHGLGKSDQEQVRKLLSQLFSQRAHAILDQRSKALDEGIAKILGRPLYTVSIKTYRGQARYRVSGPLQSLPGLKLEEKKFVLVSTEKGHPVLAKSSLLDLLATRARDLK